MKLNPFRKQSVDANTMVSLTEEGKRALDQDMIKDIRAYAVISELDQHSPQSLSTLSKSAKANIYTIKSEVTRLKRQGMVSTRDYGDDGD